MENRAFAGDRTERIKLINDARGLAERLWRHPSRRRGQDRVESEQDEDRGITADTQVDQAIADSDDQRRGTVQLSGDSSTPGGVRPIFTR